MSRFEHGAFGAVVATVASRLPLMFMRGPAPIESGAARPAFIPEPELDECSNEEQFGLGMPPCHRPVWRLRHMAAEEAEHSPRDVREALWAADRETAAAAGDKHVVAAQFMVSPGTEQ